MLSRKYYMYSNFKINLNGTCHNIANMMFNPSINLNSDQQLYVFLLYVHAENWMHSSKNLLVVNRSINILQSLVLFTLMDAKFTLINSGLVSAHFSLIVSRSSCRQNEAMPSERKATKL